MRRAHRIPLSRHAVAVFCTLHRYSGLWNKLCFPSQPNHTRPVSEKTNCLALRCLLFASKEINALGFRAFASTLQRENSKFAPAAIERALARQNPNPSACACACARGEHWNGACSCCNSGRTISMRCANAARHFAQIVARRRQVGRSISQMVAAGAADPKQSVTRGAPACMLVGARAPAQ